MAESSRPSSTARRSSRGAEIWVASPLTPWVRLVLSLSAAAVEEEAEEVVVASPLRPLLPPAVSKPRGRRQPESDTAQGVERRSERSGSRGSI
nr:unnamed protein product [Digitaria exilis]